LEPVRNRDNDIAFNAQKAEDLAAAHEAAVTALQNRVGVAEANISRGSGDGLGIAEDPYNPGTYVIADTSPLTEDPDNPGYYTF
jgi:hypothetical protein